MTPERLDACLETIGWSRQHLAERVGMSTSGLHRWTDGTVRIPDRYAVWIEKLADFVGKNPAPPRLPRAAHVGPLDPKRLERIRKLAASGKSAAEIAAAMREHPKTLRNFAARHGVRFGKGAAPPSAP